MGTWLVSAFDALSDLSVTGVTENFDLDEMPDSLSDAMLPCLLPMLFTTGGGDFGFASFEGGKAGIVAEFDHVLAVSSLGSEEALMTKSADLALYADRYITAIEGDPFLNNKVNYAVRFSLRFEVYEYAGVRYAAAFFRHRWEW